jgi:Protein of unknown function (DUF2281)
MAALEQTLIQKLQTLPAQRLAEVVDFVEFLAAREASAAASARLAQSLSQLDALNMPAVSDAEIEAEIEAARPGNFWMRRATVRLTFAAARC